MSSFKLLIILGSLLPICAFGQATLTTEARFPIPIGNNYVSNGFDRGYQGIADIGIGSRIVGKNNLSVNFCVSSSILYLKITTVTLTILSPKVTLNYRIPTNRINFLAQGGIGYSNWFFRSSEKYILTDEFGNQVGSGRFKTQDSGINYRGSLGAELSEFERLTVCILFSYEFTRLSKPEVAPNTKFNRNIQMLYPGIALMWKFRDN